MVKRYGPTTAVDGLTLTAGRGEVTAILGPNGAGKTTTIEVCEGYRSADAGTVRVLGLDPVRDAARLKPRVGVMLQAGGIPPAVPAGEYLRTLSRFHVKPHDTAWLLDIVGLTAHAKTPYKRLSGGQQQRLSLAAAVLGRPELVFLDEPTAGMDPQARHATWDLVTALQARRGRRDPHHALHGGGRAARRPRGHHRPRPRGRRRHGRRADRVRRAAPVPCRAGPGHRQPAGRPADGQRGQGIAGRPLPDRGARRRPSSLPCSPPSPPGAPTAACCRAACRSSRARLRTSSSN